MHVLGFIRLQKKVARIISASKYNAHIVPIFKQFKLLKVTDILKLQKLNCCKFKNEQLSLYTKTYIFSINQKYVCSHSKGLPGMKLWNVPCGIHNKILAILSNNVPLDMSLEKHFIKLSNDVLNDSTSIIKSVAYLSLYNHWSSL